ncbi:LuxR family two component transcriptional regulator [Palleronia aestuarii]|uniref:LuxR family two component transcriptional regulator n=1 Tax=Palleronia aestuarii TaxID=568105 RepID=A0A2W7NIT8_9RHOB|nr:response regulator transcription factor [Palleronia aestuarii]PZX13106.1 LuxR family two component transcriptional regulator [Palleronia aestuarii]
MIETICIISDSNLVRAYLEGSLAEAACTISSLEDASRFETEDPGPGEIVVWEVSCARRCGAVLDRLKSRGVALDKVILLLRGETLAVELHRFVRDIGAILGPDTPVEVLKQVLHPVQAGACVLPRRLLGEILPAHPAVAAFPETVQHLTNQERVILQRLSVGNCNKTIASELNITDGTVRVHVRSILRKLGVRNRTEAALYAGQFGSVA